MRKKQERVMQLGKVLWSCCCLSIMLLAGFASVSHALEFDLGNNAKLAWDTTLTYSLGMRVEERKAQLIANPNADDGDRNFDKWDLIQNQARLLTEADLKWKNIGMFARGRTFYDWVYNGSNHNNSPLTVNNSVRYGGELKDYQEFSEKTINRHGKDIELLDLFAYGNFQVAEQSVEARVGRQVISWGESLFALYGISTAQSPLDTTALNVPGTELRDVFLPVGQTYGKIDLPHNLSFSGYYQWEWDPNRLDEAGSYYSTFDYLDEAGRRLLLRPGVNATVDRAADDDPRNDGQYGFALRYMAEHLNETEFGIYYINYHEKFPNVIDQFGKGGRPSPINSALPAPLNVLDVSSYYLRYAEDQKLYGFSVSTVVGDTNFGAEMSYRPDYPVFVVNPSKATITGFSYRDADVLVSLLNAIHIFGPSFLADNTTLTAEAGANQVYGVDNGYRLWYDSFAWGFQAKLAFDYFGIYPGTDLKVPFTFKKGVSGDSSLLGSYIEGRDSLGIQFDFNYQKVWNLILGYTTFIGDYKNQPLTDRDNVSFALKYKF